MNIREWNNAVAAGLAARPLAHLYGTGDAARLTRLLAAYEAQFHADTAVRVFSAPGRVELCGNHTDHQQGCVVAAAVQADILAAVSKREDAVVHLISENADPCVVDLNGAPPEKGTASALIFGVASYLRSHGFAVGGFDAYTLSSVPIGSGLSSSAAFENLIATVFGALYNPAPIPPVQKALAGQWAENHCFGKPCGLMDQLASCLGGVSFMDFADPQNPRVRPLPPPDDRGNRTLCAVHTGGSHADLTRHYAAIPAEMKAVAAALSQPVLSRLTKADLTDHLPMLRRACGDRAVMRALNYFDEIERVKALARALEQGDTGAITGILSASGKGSRLYLQNVSVPDNPQNDGMGLAFYISEQVCPRGAFRVHGGGFGGTVLAWIPTEEYAAYAAAMQAVFGEGCCTPLPIRAQGGVEVTVG